MTRALLGAGATVLAAGRSAERLVELAKRLDAGPDRLVAVALGLTGEPAEVRTGLAGHGALDGAAGSGRSPSAPALALPA